VAWSAITRHSQRQQLARGGDPDGAWVQEQGGDALQQRGDRVGPGWVALGDLDPGGQASGLRVVGDGADIDALAGEQFDEGASDGAGRSGDQDHGKPFREVDPVPSGPVGGSAESGDRLDAHAVR